MANVTKINSKFVYKDRTIGYDMWYSGELSKINTILLLGTVQVGVLARAVAKIVPSNVMVVQGAPHWHAKSNGSDIQLYMGSFTEQSINTIFEIIQKDAPVVLITDSQAAPGAARYCLNYTNRVKQLVMLQPLGLSTSFFCSDPTVDPIVVFRKRIAQNFRYQVGSLATDARLVRNHAILSVVSMRDLVRQRSEQQYAAGLRYDMIYDLKKLTLPIQIVCGANDKIFPPDEIATTLRNNDIDTSIITIVPDVPHSPLATRQGRKLLEVVFNSNLLVIK